MPYFFRFQTRLIGFQTRLIGFKTRLTGIVEHLRIGEILLQMEGVKGLLITIHQSDISSYAPVSPSGECPGDRRWRGRS